jgi:hypothetical protein
VQGRPQRLIGEALLPQPGRKLTNLRSRMMANPLQDIGQVIIGIDLMQAASHDQSLHDADVSGPEFGPAKYPVFRPIGIARRARSR